MRTRNELNDAGPVTFRVQADRRKTEALMSGAADRRRTHLPAVSLDERTDARDEGAHGMSSDKAQDGRPH